MATSGSTNYSLTARQVIEFALRKVNLIALGNTSSGEMAAEALLELNIMLKEWMKYDSLWRLTEATLTPSSDTATISLSTQNPYRVVDCRYRNTDSIDTPMMELTRQEYFDIPDKTATGYPTSWYADNLRASDTLYFWPVIDTVSTDRIIMTYQRRYEDVDDPGNEIDVPQEHLSVVAFNLAARLADNFGKNGPHVDRIVARAQQLLEEVLDADRPEIIRFVPETRYG